MKARSLTALGPNGGIAADLFEYQALIGHSIFAKVAQFTYCME
jgi:hypothetical protein